MKTAILDWAPGLILTISAVFTFLKGGEPILMLIIAWCAGWCLGIAAARMRMQRLVR